ncbi:molybdate ABC transporter substrate-binding protein [Billgrantia endophytica]|nr:substrate-binding domain-containing protein [Halomonas endophytica]
MSRTMKNVLNQSKRPLLGATALALALGASASWAQPAEVSIGVVPAVQTAMPSILAAFLLEHPEYADDEEYEFVFTYDPSGVLRNAITDALNVDPNSSPYDLFLAADVNDPQALYDDFGPDEDGPVREPEDYSEGTLMLWSNGDSSSIDANLDPVDFREDFTTTAICDVAMGPYGVAATQALDNVYAIDYTQPPYDSQVIQYPNINAVNAAIVAGGGEAGGTQSGFVPTSLHCTAGQVTPPPGATYRLFEPGVDYAPTIHGAVVIERSGGETDAAQALLDFMRSEDGQDIFDEFCLSFN